MKPASLALLALLAGCESDGMSTEEIRTAAVEKARERLKLPADAPLEATIWTGSEYDGEASICGTVSGRGDRDRISPQRFLAQLEPFRWLVFEGAHDPMRKAQPDMFAEWHRYCAPEGTARVIAPSENQPCGTRMDSNQNGGVEEAEYLSFGFAFDNWDTTNDYSVSAAEFGRCWPAVASGSAEMGFRLFDEDGNGRLSQQEFFAADQFRDFVQLKEAKATN